MLRARTPMSLMVSTWKKKVSQGNEAFEKKSSRSNNVYRKTEGLPE